MDHRIYTNFIAKLKEMSATGKIKVNKNMYNISSIKRENQEVSGRFTSVMQINGKEMYKKVCCN